MRNPPNTSKNSRENNWIPRGAKMTSEHGPSSQPCREEIHWNPAGNLSITWEKSAESFENIKTSREIHRIEKKSIEICGKLKKDIEIVRIWPTLRLQWGNLATSMPLSERQRQFYEFKPFDSSYSAQCYKSHFATDFYRFKEFLWFLSPMIPIDS